MALAYQQIFSDAAVQDSICISVAGIHWPPTIIIITLLIILPR